MSVDWSVDVGHILTSVTIILSVIVLLNSRTKDRETRHRELADRIRSAAAKTLAKLERWHELALWYYRDIQPIFIDASEQLADRFEPARVRDSLWKSLEHTRIATAERIRDEEIETAYVELYAFDPGVYERFRATLAKLEELDHAIYGSFLESAQNDVLAFEGRSKGYTPALLGNELRATCERHRGRLDTEVKQALEPLIAFLVELVSQEDEELLARRSAAV